MTTLEPGLALTTCETAMRELIETAYAATLGSHWLQRISTDEQRQRWNARAQEEAPRLARGAAAIPEPGLAYANFYELLTIAKDDWAPLAPALGRMKDTMPLLRRFEELRNAVAHSRPLLAFERDLLSGIAGQIRNQVTIYMSIHDPVGDIYPRIESVTDSFGRRIESRTVDGEVAGYFAHGQIALHPGEAVTFTCVGIDPQDRNLEWVLETPSATSGPTTALAASGQPAGLQWTVTDADVSESTAVSIYLKSADGQYHRWGHFDHRVYYLYRVRPPIP